MMQRHQTGAAKLSTSKIDFYIKAGLVAAGLFIAYKVYQAGAAFVGGVSGAIGSVVDAASSAANVAGEVLTGATATEVLTACQAALKAKGLDPEKYFMMFPQPKAGEKLPVGAWVVTYKGKKYYFAPKGSTTVFSL
jgi:hypothetical protein